MPNSYVGRCFCGEVALEVTGAPKVMGYCHCASCRSWSASPVNVFTLWDPADVKVVRVLSRFSPSQTTQPANAISARNVPRTPHGKASSPQID